MTDVSHHRVPRKLQLSDEILCGERPRFHHTILQGSGMSVEMYNQLVESLLMGMTYSKIPSPDESASTRIRFPAPSTAGEIWYTDRIEANKRKRESFAKCCPGQILRQDFVSVITILHGRLTVHIPPPEAKRHIRRIQNVRIEAPVFEKAVGIEHFRIVILARVVKHGPTRQSYRGTKMGLYTRTIHSARTCGSA